MEELEYKFIETPRWYNNVAHVNLDTNETLASQTQTFTVTSCLTNILLHNTINNS